MKKTISIIASLLVCAGLQAQITERERVLGIFTAVMSVIPMIEIIVSFFKEVG